MRLVGGEVGHCHALIFGLDGGNGGCGLKARASVTGVFIVSGSDEVRDDECRRERCLYDPLPDFRAGPNRRESELFLECPIPELR